MENRELIAAWGRLRTLSGLKEDPIAFFYTDRKPEGYQPTAGKWACLVASLMRVRRKGETVFFDREHYGCGGCGYYLGFAPPAPNIDAFVSTGIPGQMAGERYKKSPDLVRRFREAHPPLTAPAQYAVFKPLAALAAEEEPALLIYFATPDELAALVSLANYPRADDAVISVFSSGCGGIVTRPLHEAKQDPPRAVLGMFDPSARPYVPENELSFSASPALWATMLENAPESFLQTETWAKVKKRLAK